MAPEHMSIIEQLASEAICSGGEALEVEYNDGYEEVYVVKGSIGHGIRLRSSSPEGRSLREDLYKIAKKRRRITVGDREYELRCHVYDSFGEDAFRVQLRPVGSARVIAKTVRCQRQRPS